MTSRARRRGDETMTRQAVWAQIYFRRFQFRNVVRRVLVWVGYTSIVGALRRASNR
jgi:hypothetical protein